IQSKESTLQVVYDVLRRSPFFKAFLVTADVPEIYIQEFWATAYVYQHSIRFKMDTRKNIVDLEAFREMLYISPRVPGQSFAELPFEEGILEFLRFLGHSAQIKTLTDVNVNKLFQPWRSFAAVINKCLTGKSSGFDSLRLSQAQILWGLYHRRNVNYAFLIWEYFVYQVEHKNKKKSNEMYYPRFTKVIIRHFMTKKPSIPKRNKVNWHYVRDDILFSTIKVVSRHQNTQQYGVILPIELTTEDIRNTKAYKEYYACATGEAAPKPKASARRKRGGSASSTTPPTPIATLTPITTIVAALRLTAAAKGKQPARATSGSSTDEGNGSKPGVPDVPSDDSEEDISWNSSDDKDVDDQTKGRDDNEESGEGADEETKSDGESEEEETKEEAKESFDPIPRTLEDSKDDGNGEEDQGLRISEEERMHEEEEADELYHRVKLLEANFLEFMRTNQSPEAVSNIPDEQRNLYKALVEAYDADKTILDSYEESAILKRKREDDDDDQEGPFARSDRESKRRREGAEDQPIVQTSQHPEWFSQPRKPPTPYRDWNKTLPAVQGNAQSWISKLAKQTDARSSFNELLDTPIDFSNFIMNRLVVDTLTPELLAGPTYELMRGSCNSLTELEYHFEEVYKATTDQLDWVNPEGQQYPHNLLQPLPLISDNRGLRVIPFEHFINNDLEYLWGGASSRKYTTSVTKTKAADYGHIKWIEDLVPRDFKRLRLQDIEDMLLLLVQGKLSNLTVEERFAFNVSLRMFTRSIVIHQCVKDL
nr:hypothetical protein [Tanacetum cinerariifolium]